MTPDRSFGIRRNPGHPPDPDHRFMVDLKGHIGIIGDTGSGKSNYIRLILHRLEKEECNVVLLDPHALVTNYALSFTHKNKVFISGLDYPGSEGLYTGINAVHFTSEQDAERVADWISETFSKEEDLSQGTWGPRLGFVFGSILARYLIEHGDSTLEDFAKFISDQHTLIKFSEEHAAMPAFNFLNAIVNSPRQYMDFITSSMNKLAPLVENSIPRRTLCMRDDRAIDLKQVLRNENNMIVPDLNEGAIGTKTTRIVSSMILGSVWRSLIQTDSTKSKTYIIVDEAEALPLNILTNLLLEGRKYGVVLVLSFHVFSLLNPSLRKSIFSSVHNWACFKMSAEDADLVSRNLEPGKFRDDLYKALMLQSFYYATVYSASASGVYGPFTVRTPLVPDSESSEGMQEMKAALISEWGGREEQHFLKKPGAAHGEMIIKFGKFLRTEGIKAKVETKMGNLVPDLSFEVSGTKIICEVENSDLMRTEVIATKLNNYRSFNLIFLCKYEEFGVLINLISLIADLAKGHRKEGWFSKRHLQHTTILSTLGQLYLVVYRRGSFYFYDGTEFVEFTSIQLLGEGSLKRRARRLPPTDMRADKLYELIDYLAKAKPTDQEALSKKFGKREISELFESLKKRGYEDLTINSLLELDRIRPRLKDT